MAKKSEVIFSVKFIVYALLNLCAETVIWIQKQGQQTLFIGFMHTF